MTTIGVRARSIIVTEKERRQVVDLSPIGPSGTRLLLKLVNDGLVDVGPGVVVAWRPRPRPV
jgi:hypothetical protein